MHDCIQVLSNTVGKAMELTGGPETVKTTEFILTFDKFFDCLNVSQLDAGKRSRNAFKSPYRSGNDFRIKVISGIQHGIDAC